MALVYLVSQKTKLNFGICDVSESQKFKIMIGLFEILLNLRRNFNQIILKYPYVFIALTCIIYFNFEEFRVIIYGISTKIKFHFSKIFCVDNYG